MNTRRSMGGLLSALPLITAGALLPVMTATAGQFEKVTDGISVYLGVVPCDVLSAMPTAVAERKMHGGIPAMANCHHVMVALFDEGSGRRIDNAAVTAEVGEYAMYADGKPLERMTAGGAVSYGNYFAIPENRMYHIGLRIHRDGLSHVTQTAFDYEDDAQ